MTHSNTVGSAIYQKIKDDIIYGKLQPSTKLKLDKLSNSYSVSMSISVSYTHLTLPTMDSV